MGVHCDHIYTWIYLLIDCGDAQMEGILVQMFGGGIVFSICYNSYNFRLQSDYFLQITFTSIPPSMYTISYIGINERIINIFKGDWSILRHNFHNIPIPLQFIYMYSIWCFHVNLSYIIMPRNLVQFDCVIYLLSTDIWGVIMCSFVAFE